MPFIEDSPRNTLGVTAEILENLSPAEFEVAVVELRFDFQKITAQKNQTGPEFDLPKQLKNTNDVSKKMGGKEVTEKDVRSVLALKYENIKQVIEEHKAVYGSETKTRVIITPRTTGTKFIGMVDKYVTENYKNSEGKPGINTHFSDYAKNVVNNENPTFVGGEPYDFDVTLIPDLYEVPQASEKETILPDGTDISTDKLAKEYRKEHKGFPKLTYAELLILAISRYNENTRKGMPFSKTINYVIGELPDGRVLTVNWTSFSHQFCVRDFFPKFHDDLYGAVVRADGSVPRALKS